MHRWLERAHLIQQGESGVYRAESRYHPRSRDKGILHAIVRRRDYDILLLHLLDQGQPPIQPEGWAHGIAGIRLLGWLLVPRCSSRQNYSALEIGTTGICSGDGGWGGNSG